MHYENPRLKGHLRELSEYPKADGEFANIDVEPREWLINLEHPEKNAT
jgi:hypothetical protein